MRLAVFTHVPHIKKGEEYYAYAPYVREMNIWFRYTEEVEIVAPLKRETEITGGESYEHKDLSFTEIPAFDLLCLKAALMALRKIPIILFRLFGAMRRADHLHLRCPGNIGLLACICQVFFPGKPKTAKYAGNWDPKAEQPWTYKLQKWILSNPFLTRNMQVLVYGEWPEQTKNILPFFTASFSEKEIEEVREKNFPGSLTFLFVGNLVEGKRPLEAIKLVKKINALVKRGTEPEFSIRLEIYGDGPERDKLQNYCRDNNLEDLVFFRGNRSLEELKGAYQKSHFVILPSRSEGWPKALAEAMFFGCVPIATPVSCIPWMFGEGSRGILLDQNGVEANARKILDLLRDQEEMRRKSKAAKDWSQQYTLERFEQAVKELLKEE